MTNNSRGLSRKKSDKFQSYPKHKTDIHISRKSIFQSFFPPHLLSSSDIVLGEEKNFETFSSLLYSFLSFFVHILWFHLRDNLRYFRAFFGCWWKEIKMVKYEPAHPVFYYVYEKNKIKKSDENIEMNFYN